MKQANTNLINERIGMGLQKLREHHTVTECEVDPVLANPVIAGRPHHARRFDIEGMGNLLAMTVTESHENQLSSFVITPYAKDLPLFSTDFVYSGEKRFFLVEVYDLTLQHSETYDAFISTLSSCVSKWSDMPDFPTKPCWYDDIRPVCIAKAPAVDQDHLALSRFVEALELFMSMDQALPPLSAEDRAAKWSIMKDYSDRLIDEGGVSTDLFTQAIGPENTRRFFDEVFFGPDCYKPR